nr:hypothetical protein [Tanacetum cinerariifolium]
RAPELAAGRGPGPRVCRCLWPRAPPAARAAEVDQHRYDRGQHPRFALPRRGQRAAPAAGAGRAAGGGALHPARVARAEPEQLPGQRWQAAADQALRDSLVVALPVLETGFFRADQPTAASYRYQVVAGEQ